MLTVTRNAGYADVLLAALDGDAVASRFVAIVNAIVEQIQELQREEFGDDSALMLGDFMALNCESGIYASVTEVITALKSHLVALRDEADYLAREQLTERDLLAML